MTKVATKADLLATKADLVATTADLQAAFEAQTERLTIILGGILIAGFVAIGVMIFASVPLLAP
jgi:hypothetical protein